MAGHVLAELRLSVNTALLITIGIELLAAQQGLGAMIWFSWEILRTLDLFVGLLVIALIGIASNATLLWLRKRLVPWSPLD